MLDIQCRVCGNVIPAGRLKALPGVDTCTVHSDAKPRREEDVVDGPDQSDMPGVLATAPSSPGEYRGR